jgi:hypothetical protein
MVKFVSALVALVLVGSQCYGVTDSAYLSDGFALYKYDPSSGVSTIGNFDQTVVYVAYMNSTLWGLTDSNKIVQINTLLFVAQRT